jgi:hypothetical protein
MNRDRYTKTFLALWNFCVELAEAASMIWLAVLLPKKNVTPISNNIRK